MKFTINYWIHVQLVNYFIEENKKKHSLLTKAKFSNYIKKKHFFRNLLKFQQVKYEPNTKSVNSFKCENYDVIIYYGIIITI